MNMQLMKFGSFALVAALAAGSVGCVVRAHGRVGVPVTVVEVDEEPPPPRVYVRDTRPGFVFIQGRWIAAAAAGSGVTDTGSGTARIPLEDGRWERRGRGHVWVEGRWHAESGGGNDGGNVRDHRRNDAPPRRRPTTSAITVARTRPPAAGRQRPRSPPLIARLGSPGRASGDQRWHSHGRDSSVACCPPHRRL